MRGGPRLFPQGFTCPVVLRIPPRAPRLRLRGSHPLRPAFPGPFGWLRARSVAVHTPACTHAGLGSSGSARRYSRNHCCFLFLRLLRCFSSPGSPRAPMDSARGGGGWPRRVSPFRHLRIWAHLRLPAAFRSLSRLSSAPGAKASAPCPYCLTVRPFSPSVALLGRPYVPVFRLPRSRGRRPLHAFPCIFISFSSDVSYPVLQTLILV